MDKILAGVNSVLHMDQIITIAQTFPLHPILSLALIADVEICRSESTPRLYILKHSVFHISNTEFGGSSFQYIRKNVLKTDKYPLH